MRRPSPHFIAALVIIAALALVCVWFTASILFWVKAQTQEPNVTQSVTLTRPQLCQQYYDDGTSQWIDCMGVGYR